MKMFELNGRTRKNGRRPFRAILHEVYPDSCIEGNVGTQFNDNGICWISEYCASNIDTIKGMSLTCEFSDEVAQDGLLGHGDTGFDNNLPVFDKATIVGNFSKGYIDDVEINGVMKRVMIGEGTIDQMRCNNFVKYLEQLCEKNSAPKGSVEIVGCADIGHIEYLNGKHEEGRIPTVFEYSGYSLLGVRPADQTAAMLELNEHQTGSEGNTDMDEMKAMLTSILEKMEAMLVCRDELQQIKSENEQLISAQSEINATSEQIQKALDKISEEYKDLNTKYDQLWAERQELVKQLGEALAKERVGELNAALAVFTAEQIAFADAERAAFEADPVKGEINTVIEKIYIGIGKQTIEAAKIAEQNAENEKDDEPQADDIFSEVNHGAEMTSDEIF